MALDDSMDRDPIHGSDDNSPDRQGRSTFVAGERTGEIGVTLSGLRPPSRSIVEISPANIARRRLANWGAIQGERVNVTRRETFEYGFQAPRHLLIAHERGEREDGETLIEGLPRSTLREFNCKLSFVPAGHKFFGWQTPRVLTRVTYFYIDLQDRLFDLESGGARPTIGPRLFFFDQAVWDTALKLKAEVGNSDPGSRQYAEALGVVLVHELIRLERATTATARLIRGGLPVWQQKRVIEFIEEHLTEDISLAALAELAGLSLYHFARAFTQSFGVPPHHYHMARRIGRARNLLQAPTLSVTQIGVQVGFRETSSFTRAFRRFTGLTPTEYRRHRGG
ncbi:AraC family transcriptional regulator [Bradyrhizobium sp. NP1]|uniref:helix-turn-helix domain-containing protein n=1 Tax=Bradyrhizobium sp. NP1 TaxID=3049772 RepID=UPI0025A62657|nr:AraC family transcriptional regulator [Bradyrhizobium sp. NP1]WJR77233.1 AraC family transcriptional regulator [Bradyrhizobium sp. NP1]